MCAIQMKNIKKNEQMSLSTAVRERERKKKQLSNTYKWFLMLRYNTDGNIKYMKNVSNMKRIIPSNSNWKLYNK